MHEMAIGCALMDVVSAEMRRRGGGRVAEIRMTIGALQGIEPRSLQSAFEVLAADTELAGARLSITRRPLRIFCRTCQAQEIADSRFRCRSCEGGDVSVLPAGAMTVDEIIVCP